MSKVLLDTDILSEILKGKSAVVAARAGKYLLAAPILGLTGCVAWIWSDLHCGSMRALPVPLTTKGWLLILPYVLLFPVLLSRDAVQRWFLRRSSRPLPATTARDPLAWEGDRRA